MLVNELSTRDSLVRMVRRLTANRALREDLLQEALVHLWITEIARAGQTRSWYLQSCKYHLLHYLAAGRSVDSAKRRDHQMAPADNHDGPEYLVDDADSGESVYDLVSARDIISLLSPQLNLQEQAVLGCFAEGLRLREIGRKLKMSHTMVIRHRKKIASLLNRLDRSPAARMEASENGSQSRTKAAPEAAFVTSVSTVNGFKSPHCTNGHAVVR
jgi:DNA-directed RNA polymerase specialized sigma24 family protein